MSSKIFYVVHIDDNSELLIFTEEIIDEIEGIEIAYTSFTNRGDFFEEEIEVPDLIITDLMLEPDKQIEEPAQTGIDFIQNIKSNETFKNTKIMVFSARSDDFLKKELSPYVVKYCTKDMTDSEFQQTIKALLTGN